MRECGLTFAALEDMTLAEISCLLASADDKKQTPDEMQAAALAYQAMTPVERLLRARRG